MIVTFDSDIFFGQDIRMDQAVARFLCLILSSLLSEEIPCLNCETLSLCGLPLRLYEFKLQM